MAREEKSHAYINTFGNVNRRGKMAFPAPHPTSKTTTFLDMAPAVEPSEESG